MEDKSEARPYPEKLSEVRRLSADSEQGLRTKREAARDLRIEIYLSWAHVADTTIETLLDKPLLSDDELQAVVARQKPIIPKPEVADQFLNSLILARNRSLVVERVFRVRAKLPETDKEVPDWPKEEKEKVGRLAFKELTGKDPVDKVSLMDTTIALGVELGEEDFETLDPRINIAGFYMETGRVKIGRFQEDKLNFPFIGVKRAEEQGRVVRHELAHAVNSSIIQALIKSDARLRGWVWGGEADIKLPEIKSIDELNSHLRKRALPYALSRAKDEILADYGAISDFSHLDNLTLRHGIYDYFDERIRFLRDKGLLEVGQGEVDSVVNGYWQEYITSVKKAVWIAKTIDGIYSLYGLGIRRRLFKFVLAQIPMAGWAAVLERDFLSEARAFEQSQWRGINLALEARVDAGSEFEGTVTQGQVKRATLIAIENEAYEIVKKGLKRTRNNLLSSLFPISREVEERINFLREKYERIK